MNELAIRIINPEEGQFLRRIEWNKEEFEGWMQELSARYADTVIVTPDDYKASKADRAELNKVAKAISARRVEVKSAILEPYTVFEEELGKATADVDKITARIDKSIKKYEAEEKEKKKSAIRKIFDNEVRQPFYEEVPASEMAFLDFERIFDQKWLNASAKMPAVEKELNEKLAKVENGLRAILTMDTAPELRAGAMAKFKETLDLGAALRLHGDLAAKAMREKEEQRRREEAEAERRRQKEAEELEKKRQQDMQALRERLAGEKQPDRVQAPVSGVSTQGGTNYQTQQENAVERARDGKFGASMQMSNGNRYTQQGYSPYEGVSGAREAIPQTPPPMPQPQPKMYAVEFRVMGTKEELMALREYMNSNGLRYEPIRR